MLKLAMLQIPGTMSMGLPVSSILGSRIFKQDYLYCHSASDPNEAAKQLHDTLTNILLKAKAEGSDDTLGKIRLSHLVPSNQADEPKSGSGSPALKSHKTSISSALSSATDTDPGGSNNTQSQSPSSGNNTAAFSSQSRSTLASLGIPEPHVAKSKRRSRRPFTTAEDEALLKGYAVHGFQWTLIQQDQRLQLSHRKATDLRDRFRTKFPHAYRDGGSVSGKALTTQTQTQDPATGTSTPRPHASNTSEQSPGKPFAMSPTQTPATTPRTSVSRSRHAATSSQSNITQLDPALLPPPAQGHVDHSMYPPPTAAGVLSFSLDDAAGAGVSSTVETPWEDNTLAPMIWDELN